MWLVFFGGLAWVARFAGVVWVVCCFWWFTPMYWCVMFVFWFEYVDVLASWGLVVVGLLDGG